MKTALSCLGLAVAVMAAGCEQHANTNTSLKPDVEASTVPKADPAEPGEPAESVALAENSDAVPDTTEHAEHAGPDSPAHGGPGMGRGRGGMGRGPGGMGGGPGMGRGPGAMGGMREDMTTLHAMFADRDKIRRTITNLPDGAEAVTESDDPEIAGLLQQHVPAMESRVLKDNPLPPMTFHPIFIELIKHSDDYALSYEETEKGMKVKYTSDDPYVVMLVQEHAKLVSRFIKNGMEEIHKPYTLPQLGDESKESAPAASPEQDRSKAQAKAIEAKDALFQRLSGRLAEAMKTGGPAAAIEVCSHEASDIAAVVGKEHGVKIGRTSIKLRNSKNVPPDWAKSCIEDSSSEPQTLDLPNGETGVLLPIKLQAKCVACHGPTEMLNDEVRQQLAKFYPDDEATGFKEGDLRGWFWIEVPRISTIPNQPEIQANE